MQATPVDFDTVVEMIEEFPRQVKWAIEHAPEGRMIDVLATINHVATAINIEKRRAASEVQADDHGETWKVEQGRKGMRSYNTEGIIGLVAETYQIGPFKSMRLLMNRGVLRLSWSWSELDKLIRSENLELRVARHEIEDGDPDYDMGEYWVDGPVRYVPNKEGR